MRSQKKCVKSPNMKNCNNLFDKQIFKIYQKTQKERQHLEGYGEKPLGSQSLFKKSQVTRLELERGASVICLGSYLRDTTNNKT